MKIIIRNRAGYRTIKLDNNKKSNLTNGAIKEDKKIKYFGIMFEWTQLGCPVLKSDDLSHIRFFCIFKCGD